MSVARLPSLDRVTKLLKSFRRAAMPPGVADFGGIFEFSNDGVDRDITDLATFSQPVDDCEERQVMRQPKIRHLISFRAVVDARTMAELPGASNCAWQGGAA